MRLPFAMLEVFDAIAREGSLRGAADRLGLKASTVSHQLKSLEERLDVDLFIRTTRSISFTEAGRALHRGSAPAFEQLGEAVEAARTTGDSARGTLRLTAAEHAYHTIIADKLPTFRSVYPEIEVEISLSDALVDILEEGFHAGFRLGNVVAQDMIAVRLTAPLPIATVASPGYLDRAGRPDTPADLLAHECIRYRFRSSRQTAPWLFEGAEGEEEVAVAGKLLADDLPVLVDMAKRGNGLIHTFRDYIADSLESGELEQVLSPFSRNVPGLFIYFPREYRNMTPLRLFIDHLK
ncbi:LysR substrate-binding domain-containing protein [Gymnodinialimonas hymeniacidonis]|uniref:LysR substrate-binding domain-containing protein n=1 Tax=Gymnodinialimonas hymeniacidonis TaxID=3126508 RepID=UPI0034C5BA6B